jgi:hypothetical protein
LQFNLNLLNRPRISIKVDEYIWSLIEQNIVIPKKIMQSDKYDYNLVVSFDEYNAENHKFSRFSPYNGSLKENAVLSTYHNPNEYYSHDDFVGGAEQTTWFNPGKFWINSGVKTASIGVSAANANQDIVPVDYANLLFDAFAATLLLNFKKLKKSEFDELKTHIDYDVVCSFPFPAPFIEQKYQSDERYIKSTRLLDDGSEDVLVDIPNIEAYYKQHYNE